MIEIFVLLAALTSVNVYSVNTVIDTADSEPVGVEIRAQKKLPVRRPSLLEEINRSGWFG
ncbi:MAG: hypothetical protein KUG73_08535 [Pseudomonadales bacterium]|nr:hypothetical protein [Pseudomonadales bacterium]